VPDEAKHEKERTYGSAHWKRADGQAEPGWDGKKVGGKPCEHLVIGVVVAGPGRGEAFPVCVDKKKCKVHWAQEQRDVRAGGNNSAAVAKERERALREQQRWKEQHEREDRERKRWQKAAPAILDALLEKVKTAATGPDSPLGRLVLERCTGYRQKTDLLKPGRTAEGLVRYAGFLMVAATLEAWNAPNEGPKLLKAFGVDAKKVLDEVAPEPKAKRPEAAKPKAKAAAPDAGGVTVVETGKHAGDVRRAKKQKGEAQCHGRAGGFFHHGVCAMKLVGLLCSLAVLALVAMAAPRRAELQAASATSAPIMSVA
jgi:hypothetical protein